MEKEIWLPVRGYVGLYEVSNFGNVRSLNYGNTGRKELLSLVENEKGYLRVQLWKNGKPKSFRVHRLVAEAFIPNWFDDKEINHKSEIKTDNRVDNLEWCDRKYNINYGTRKERVSKKMINNEKLSKPVLQLTKIGELVREWISTAEVGRNGFNQGNIVSCCNGKRKTYKGFVWKYKEVS